MLRPQYIEQKFESSTLSQQLASVISTQSSDTLCYSGGLLDHIDFVPSVEPSQQQQAAIHCEFFCWFECPISCGVAQGSCLAGQRCYLRYRLHYLQLRKGREETVVWQRAMVPHHHSRMAHNGQRQTKASAIHGSRMRCGLGNKIDKRIVVSIPS